MGNPQKPEVFVNIDYNFSNYRLTTEINRVKQDSLLRFNQFIPSISIELLQWRNSSIRTKAGFIFAFLKDDISRLDDVSPGFKLGLSMENKLFRSQAVHFDVDYDLMKVKDNRVQDYDLWKLSFGIYL
jgi:hypothetical protein